MENENKTEKENKKSWFKRHPILSIVIGFFVLGFIVNVFESANNTYIKETIDYNQMHINNIAIRDYQVDTKYTIKSINSSDSKFNDINYKNIIEKVFIYVEFLNVNMINYNLIEFENEYKALDYYNNEVNNTIEKRGYEVINYNNNLFHNKFAFTRNSMNYYYLQVDRFVFIVSSKGSYGKSQIEKLLIENSKNIKEQYEVIE